MIAKMGVFLRDEGGATSFKLGVITAMVSVVAIHPLYLLMGGV